MTDIVERLRNPNRHENMNITMMEAADEIERLREKLQHIVQWSEAYPTDVFPEPDWKHARTLLEAGGITLDSVSASCMRRVVEGVGKIARHE